MCTRVHWVRAGEASGREFRRSAGSPGRARRPALLGGRRRGLRGAAGSPVAAREVSRVKVCDICRQVTTHLEIGPPELEPLEVCDECRQELLKRLSVIEKRLAETRQAWR